MARNVSVDREISLNEMKNEGSQFSLHYFYVKLLSYKTCFLVLSKLECLLQENTDVFVQ